MLTKDKKYMKHTSSKILCFIYLIIILITILFWNDTNISYGQKTENLTSDDRNFFYVIEYIYVYPIPICYHLWLMFSASKLHFFNAFIAWCNLGYIMLQIAVIMAENATVALENGTC